MNEPLHPHAYVAEIFPDRKVRMIAFRGADPPRSFTVFFTDDPQELLVTVPPGWKPAPVCRCSVGGILWTGQQPPRRPKRSARMNK